MFQTSVLDVNTYINIMKGVLNEKNLMFITSHLMFIILYLMFITLYLMFYKFNYIFSLM